jgi:hypothetical protein
MTTEYIESNYDYAVYSRIREEIIDEVLDDGKWYRLERERGGPTEYYAGGNASFTRDVTHAARNTRSGAEFLHRLYGWRIVYFEDMTDDEKRVWQRAV